MINALAAIPDSVIFADKLVHASIIDGMNGVKNRFRFAHNDLGYLERLINNYGEKFRHKIIVVESVYSMDGDTPDLETLIEIKKKYPGVILYVDEAHAFGVSGPSGLGLTMGKALGSYGAFAVMKPELRDFFINKARSLIFSTSLPPQTALWSRIMIERMVKAEDSRRHLRELSELLHESLCRIDPGTSRVPGHIAYVVTGDPHRAVELSRKLKDGGITVLPIRTPTVPPGTDRLRISLSAAHSAEDVKTLISALERWL